MQLFQHSQHNYLVLNYSAPKHPPPLTTISSVPFKYHVLGIASSLRTKIFPLQVLDVVECTKKGSFFFLLVFLWEVEFCFLIEEAECAHMARSAGFLLFADGLIAMHRRKVVFRFAFGQFSL